MNGIKIVMSVVNNERRQIKDVLLAIQSCFQCANHQVNINPKQEFFGVGRGRLKSAYKPSGLSGRAYPGFLSMKQLGVFLLPPGWNATPLQGYPQ